MSRGGPRRRGRAGPIASSLCAALLACLLAPRSAPAAGPEVELVPIAPELLRALAPQLGGQALALFDQEADGAVRQLTTVLPVAAPPALVREVLIHPEAWPRFLRNVSRSEVTADGDGEGRFLNRWRIELPIGHFDSEDRWSVGAGSTMASPTAPGGELPPVEVQAIGEGRRGRQRYHLLALPGGGTLLVQYGHHDGFEGNLLLGAMLRRNKSYGAAMSLAASLVVVQGIKGEAERRARASGPAIVLPPAPAGRGPGLGALLPRGVVAVLRSGPGGELLDVSVVKRVSTPLPRVLELVRHPERWPGTIPSVKRVSIERRDGRGIDFRIVIDGVLFEVDARFRQDDVPGGADALGTGGDLLGTRFRWDLAPERDGATRAVWRGNAHLGDASRVLRALFRFEPLFEHAANVGAGLIALRAIAARAALPDPP